MTLLPLLFLFSIAWPDNLNCESAPSTGRNQNALLFHIHNDLIAVGRDDRITIHRYDGDTINLSTVEREISLKRTFSGSDVPTALLHLELINSTTVSYCDPLACWLCHVDSKGSVCYGYFVNDAEEEPKRRMETVKCLVTDNHMTVRFIDDSQKASIVKFDLSDATDIQQPVFPTFRADDKEMNSITNQKLVAGFEWNGFSYFVGSAERLYQPRCKFGSVNECYSPNNKRENVRLTRVCDKDETTDLESRVDIALSCEPNHYNSALASYFDPSQRSLSVAFASPSLASFSVCKFDIDQIEQQFNDTWSICQRVKETQHCQRRNTSGHPECKIMSRNFKTGSYSFCKRYFGNNRPDDEINICSLHKYSLTHYRFGWLENFDTLPGTPVLSLTTNSSQLTMASLTVHAPSDSIFLVTGESRRAPRLDRYVSSTNHSIWNVTTVDATPSFQTSQTNKLLYVRNNAIEVQDISCRNLYKTCHDLPGLLVKDPLQCAWCVVGNGEGYSTSANQENTCSGQLVYDGCPPVIDQTLSDESGSFTIFGSNFMKFANPKIFICGKPCGLTDHRDAKMVCKTHEAVESCSVEVSGKLPSSRFTATARSSSYTAPEKTGKKKSDTTTMKAVISVVAIIVLMLIIGLIVYLIRRYKKKNDKRMINSTSGGSNVPLNLIGPGFGLKGTTNDYNMHNASSSQYEYQDRYLEQFGRFAKKDQININNLRVSSEIIGEGHYGSVVKGTYTINGVELEVACKTVHARRVLSTADFLSEAELMARLDHPRILPFIGVYYDSIGHKIPPILVTKYMVNGDLMHYVRNPENSITLNKLLQFCLEAAEAMEYLHSQEIIHRDLAARNCMLDENLSVCLADFGLARLFKFINQDGYDALNSRELPITALSLEAFNGHFSTKSDVWAFGNLVWEATSRGWAPWGGFTKQQIQETLQRGERLEIPKYCPEEIYHNIMLRCWEELKENRPSFTELIDIMRLTIEELRLREASRMNSNYEMVAPVKRS